jgi:NAD(P)-dependent dehydrogenase (short-subunit alcohol dehydrogenase family)
MTEQARVVYVLTSGLDIGSTMAASLASRGARVAWLTDGPAASAVEPPAGVTRIAASFASRAALEQAFAAALECVGAASQVVLSALPHAALQAQDVMALSDDDWRASCGAAMKSVLFGLQASHSQMAQRGGSVVAVGPTLSLAGAPQLVPLSTAVEGQRGLVKSTARQWGKLGLTVNWVAAAPRALSSLFDTLTLPVKPDRVPVAFGRPLDLGSEIVPVIEFLGSAAGRAMTGATLVLDGGEWMLP